MTSHYTRYKKKRVPQWRKSNGFPDKKTYLFNLKVSEVENRIIEAIQHSPCTRTELCERTGYQYSLISFRVRELMKAEVLSQRECGLLEIAPLKDN